ncbi:MAG: 23S rRNA (adenine(2503)-C(2))-methyltransferase RlmN [Bacteroidales bacterium]|nr:23S rRNA (adenine(2503)-C(2))-methyltransferase RlmN [Bacteroidales bacterium]
MKKKLLGLSLSELQTVVQDLSLPRFTAGQIAKWLYVKRVSSIDAMTDLSKQARQALSESYETGWTYPCESVRSKDGTVKYLFKVSCDVGTKSVESAIEAVVIPDSDRKTLCISSQAGCKMGCKFCMTGRGGWHGNLDRAQILSQIMSIPEGPQLTNVVFMGMGEPLDNYDTLSAVLDVMTSPWGFAWSPKRITVSSIGVLPNLKRLLDEHKCHVAISLHNPFPDERLSMMPVQGAYPFLDVLALLRRYDFTGQRRVSFEYTMFEGFNDDKRHADALGRLLRGLECRVNLIRFHKIPDFPYGTSSDRTMEAFRDRLNTAGITATIRASRGEDIFAACGLLAGRHQEADRKTAISDNR